MLRVFGLLVAISIALLLRAVRPSESRSETQAEAVPPAQAAPPSNAAIEPRWIDRPVPRVADVSPANQADEPDPWSGSPGREELEPHHTDLDPGPPQAVEAATEAEAEPAYVPTAADEALVSRAIDFLDEFLTAIESSAGDCDRMADSLSELLSSSRDLIAEGKAMADQPTRSRWFESRMAAKMTAWSGIMTPLQGCMSNERMMAALTLLAE